MTTESRRFYWRLCYGAVILLSILTFTPAVTPIGTYQPMVLGLPYTLWTGILVTIGLVALTYAAGRLFPVERASNDNDS